jgi:DNA-3-methyladenine glycosylase II
MRIEQSRIGVPQMEPAVRAGSEAENRLRHEGIQAMGRGRARRIDQMATILDSEEALKTGLAALGAADPVMARIVAEGAVPPLRKRPPGFEGLAGIIVAQQVSTASAAAIGGRLKERFDGDMPSRILAASDEDLRSVGLSAAKIRTLRAVAAALKEGSLPLDALHEFPVDEAHERLIRIKGIGPWTADVYLLFCLGHPDAFPAGDLALQEAARIAFALDERPGAASLTALAERWRPWRGVAAKVLWAFYRLAKSRDATPLPVP